MTAMPMDGSRSVPGILAKLLRREDLGLEEAEFASGEILSDQADPAQAAALLVALHSKGESAQEIAALARAVQRPPVLPRTTPKPMVDLSGTGGDGAGTFNISTAASFVVAGTGLTVAKGVHPAVSSACGSAECLAALGVRVDLSPEEMLQSLVDVGMTFVSVPRYMPACRRIHQFRRSLGISTALDLLPVLINPAGATHRVIGVSEPRHTEPVARVCAELGFERALVLHGLGLDEATLQGETRCYEASEGRVRNLKVDPLALGFSYAPLAELAGGSPDQNARILREILMDVLRGPPRDAVVLNAAVAIWVSGRVRFLGEAVQAALGSITNGKALAKLNALRERFSL